MAITAVSGASVSPNCAKCSTMVLITIGGIPSFSSSDGVLDNNCLAGELLRIFARVNAAFDF